MKNIKRITTIVLLILLLLSGSVFAAGFQITSIPDPFPSVDTTYFGRWTALPSTITFDTNGGSEIDDMSDVTDAVVADITMPTTTRDGYTFLGWFDNEVLTGEAVTELPGTYPANGITYYAKWNVSSQSVTYVYNDGVTDNLVITAESGTLLSEPTSPDREGYSLNGWYKDSGLTDKWNFSTDIVSTDLALYAGWSTVVELPAEGTALMDATWEEIALVAEKGLGDTYWDVGDTKTVSIGGTSYTVAIYGFDHDDLANGSCQDSWQFFLN
jgi:uncharacterized repeat protein (TIGR02543 family)